MLKFIKNHMATIEGIDILACVALVLFMSIFLYVSYYSFFIMKEDLADEISSLPLEEGELGIKK